MVYTFYIAYMGSFLASTFLISFVKESVSTNYFSLSGTKFHFLGPKFDKLSVPWYTDLALGIAK